jgi:hypothetical protein
MGRRSCAANGCVFRAIVITSFGMVIGDFGIVIRVSATPDGACHESSLSVTRTTSASASLPAASSPVTSPRYGASCNSRKK